MSVSVKLTEYDHWAGSNSSATIVRMERALNVATASTCRQKHGAVLMQGSRVLAVGVNSYRNDPKNISWPSPDLAPSGISVHAEVQATKTHLDVPNTTLYLVRVSSAGVFMPSKPCPECLYHLIWNTTVKEVIYS